jgi:hypothetical protein
MFTMLHIARGFNIDENIFTHEDVSKFHDSLGTILASNITPGPRKFLSPNFDTLFSP